MQISLTYLHLLQNCMQICSIYLLLVLHCMQICSTYCYSTLHANPFFSNINSVSFSFSSNHSGKYNVGQNLAYGYSTWEDTMKAWYDEYKDFNYGKLKHNGVVGHYTQVYPKTL